MNKWEEAVEKEKEIIDDIFIQYFPYLSKDELNVLLDHYKTQFYFKSRRLRIIGEKMQSVEVETHQIERNIQTMYKQSQWTKKQDTMEKLEMDEKGIVQANIVYPIKKKDDTTSQLVIFVDDIQDTIDLSRNIIELDVQAMEELVIQSSVDITPPPVKD